MRGNAWRPAHGRYLGGHPTTQAADASVRCLWHGVAVWSRFASGVRRLSVVVQMAWFLVLGGFIFIQPRFRGGGTGAMLRLALGVFRFIAFWTLVWTVLWQIDQTLLVGSRSGLQTVLQVLIAAIVALLVLVLGSLFVTVQIVVQLWGTRAPVMVGLEGLSK